MTHYRQVLYIRYILFVMQHKHVHVVIHSYIYIYYGQVIFYFDTVAAAGNIHDFVFTFFIQ